uniref:NTF2 domain-containing protein n=1 Tax=Cuerna arida TaxID=1464854 RepID=A0A1B6ESY0_9HEMI
MCSPLLRLCDCVILHFNQCKFKYSFSMLTLEEKVNIEELLNGVSLDDLNSLASTITKGLLKTCTRQEASNAILQHSDTVESILNRKKISRELLFNYLHWKKVTTDSNLDKKSLINLLTNYWREQLHDGGNPPREANNVQSNVVQTCVNPRSQLISTQLEPVQLDLLALKFTEWYYQLLNKDFLDGSSFALGSENFWSDSTIQIMLNSNGEVSTEEAESATAVVALLAEIKQRHKLYFSPNLSTEGVKGRSEAHGLVVVLVCGTLHQSAGVVVGLFEQTFYLIRDPLTNNSWKIKRSQLMLTSKSNVAALPTLSDGDLTRPLLPIQSPD